MNKRKDTQPPVMVDASATRFALADAVIGVACTVDTIIAERDALRQRLESEERDCLDVMRERDWAQNCLQQTHIALGGDGEWCGKMPAEMPPDSGDLHYDVPALAREVIADRDRLAARCEGLEKMLRDCVTQVAKDVREEFSPPASDATEPLAAGVV